MPIYRFECTKCGEVWEELAPMDTQEAKCPICAARGERRPTAAAVHFRGEWP